MKKQLFPLLLLALMGFSFTACEKDSENGDISITQNTWKLMGLTYTVDESLGPFWDGDDFSLSAVTAGGENSIIIFFKSRPVAGTYKILDASDVNAEDLENDECLISFFTASAPNLFWSSGKAGDVLKVAVSGGKLRVTYNDIEVGFFGSAGTETTTSSAHLLEK